mgnify:CR=1 FL=1
MLRKGKDHMRQLLIQIPDKLLAQSSQVLELVILQATKLVCNAFNMIAF